MTARALRLAVDAHNLLSDRRGIGVYVRALLARYAARDDVELTLLARELFPRRLFAALAHAIGSERFAVARRVPREADVAWHPWNGTFFSSGRAVQVATVHDVTPFAFPASEKGRRRREQQPFRRSARAARVLTDSQFSAREIEVHLGVEAARIAVVPLAADPRFTPAPEGEPEHLPEALRERSYLLAVGANDERKNLQTLARAHRAAFPDGEVALACVTRGAPDGAFEIADAGFETLRDLYRNALAFVMPSRYEGFGIPPLEAMRCATPVVVSRAASLPEVCGDAALYVDDYESENAWRDALRRIVEDAPLRASLRERGLVQAQRFTWNRTADATLAVLREASEMRTNAARASSMKNATSERSAE